MNILCYLEHAMDIVGFSCLFCCKHLIGIFFVFFATFSQFVFLVVYGRSCFVHFVLLIGFVLFFICGVVCCFLLYTGCNHAVCPVSLIYSIENIEYSFMMNRYKGHQNWRMSCIDEKAKTNVTHTTVQLVVKMMF